MADNLLGGLFGLSPEDAEQQSQQQQNAFAMQLAQMNPNQIPAYAAARAGGALGGMLGNAMGLVDPNVEMARRRQQALGQAKLDTPDEIRATAERFRQMGDMKTAFGLAQYAKQMQEQLEEKKLKRRLSEAQIKNYEETKDSRTPEIKNIEAFLEARGLKKGTPEWSAAFVENMQALKADKADKLPTSVQEYEFAKKDGFKGSYTEWLRKKAEQQKIVVNTGNADAAPLPTDETALEFAAQQYLLGDTQWAVGIGRSRAGADFIRNVKNRAAEIAKENGMSPSEVIANRQEIATRLKAQKDFSTGAQGKAISSFNAAIDHLGTLEKLGADLDNTDLRVVNRVYNAISKELGVPAPASFDAAKQILGQEITKAIVAGGGGVQERMEAGRLIEAANSPAQLREVIKTYKELMAGQLKSLKLQYQQTTKRTDFDERLTPSAKKELRGASAVSMIPTETATQQSAIRKYNPATGRIE